MSIKKISKLLIALILAVSFVFALCSCGSPEAKFEKAQKEEISEFLDSILNTYSNTSTPEEMSVDSKIKVTLGAPLLSSLKANTGMSFDWIKDLSIDLSSTIKDSAFSADAELSYNSKVLASIATILDMEKGNAYVSIPQISEKFLGISLGMIPSTGMMGTLDTMPSPETLRKVIDKYLDIIFDNLPEMETEKGALTIDGISESCTVYTIKFTKANILNLGKTMIETVKDDTDIKEFIMDLYEAQTGGYDYEDYTAQDAYNDFKEYLTDMLSEIEEELKADDINNVYATWTSYFKKNEIIGNKIELPEANFEFFCGTAQEKSDSRFDFHIISESKEVFSITGDLTENKNKLSGELELKVSEKSICFIGLENFDKNTWEDGYINGTISISPSKGAMDFIRNMVSNEYATFISTCSLKFDITSSKNKGDVTISLMSGNEPYFSLSLVSNAKDFANINIPSDSQTIYDAENWAESLDPNKFEEAINAIKNSGLPSEIVDLIESFIPSFE